MYAARGSAVNLRSFMALRSKECPAVALHSPFHRMTTMKLLTFVLLRPSLPPRRLLLFAVLPPAASPPLPHPVPILLPSFPPFQWHLYLQVYGCRRMWDPMPRTPCHVVSLLFCITVLELEKPLPDGLRDHDADK